MTGPCHTRIHGQYASAQIARIPWAPCKDPKPSPFLPAIRQRLYLHLQRTNYVKPVDIAHRQCARWAVEVMMEARMSLYCERRRLWVPDVGTMDWLIANRPLTCLAQGRE
jgi:hypothetical protein